MEPDEQTIGGYRITGSLGADETGQSYLAEDSQSDRPCVVKILHEDLSKDKRFGERFRSVARAMGDLTHPRIAGVSEMRRAEGRYFVVSEYVAGPRGKPMSLQEYLAYRSERADGTVPGKIVKVWAVQIAEALAFAHDLGQRHHSLRPDKVLIDAENNLRVAEFGLARAVGEKFLFTRILARMQTALAEALSRPRAPYTGAEPGAYDYLAPEQRCAAQVDERADIYAFGVLLYRMLTGRGPGNFAQRPSDVVDDISPQWDAVVMQCLAEGPTDRYPSAEALLKAVKGVGADVPAETPDQARGASAVLVASLDSDMAAAAAASAAIAAAGAGDIPQLWRAPRKSSVFSKIMTSLIVLMLASLIMFGPKLAAEFSRYFGGKGQTVAGGSGAGDDREPDGGTGPGFPARRNGNPPDTPGNPLPRETGRTVIDALRDQALGRTTAANTEVRLMAPPVPKTPRESAVDKMRRVAAISTRTPDAIARQFMDPSRLKRATTSSEARKAFYMGQAMREPAEKIKHYTRAIEFDERYAWAYVQRGFAYFFNGQYIKALADYTKAIELDGDDYVPYYCRALTFEKLERKLMAEHDYKRAEALAPKDPAWYIHMGNYHATAGRHDEAIAEYTKAIKLKPNSTLAFNNRGVAYSDKGQYTLALTDLTTAITLDTNSFQGYFNRGLTYLRMKRYDEAIRDNTSALVIKPRNLRALYNRGYAHRQKGNIAAAEADFDEVKSIVAPTDTGERLFD